MDPIDPAFLERTFDLNQPGFQRVQRVRPARDEQPAEEWQQQGERQRQHGEPGAEDEDEDVYEPSTRPAQPGAEDEGTPENGTDAASATADWDGRERRASPGANRAQRPEPDSVVVDLEDDVLPPPPPPHPGHDDHGPHIDISV